MTDMEHVTIFRHFYQKIKIRSLIKLYLLCLLQKKREIYAYYTYC
jgi:hypothetical protein